MTVVIDANVLAAADGLAQQAGQDCITECCRALMDARAGRIVVDTDGAILQEYRRCARRDNPPSVALEFLLHILRSEFIPNRVERVAVTDHPERRYAEFPDEPDLNDFDVDDRVYVAVALTSQGRPSIDNATDTDWWAARTALAQAGIVINFLCPELMQNGRADET